MFLISNLVQLTSPSGVNFIWESSCPASISDGDRGKWVTLLVQDTLRQWGEPSTCWTLFKLAGANFPKTNKTRQGQQTAQGWMVMLQVGEDHHSLTFYSCRLAPSFRWNISTYAVRYDTDAKREPKSGSIDSCSAAQPGCGTDECRAF